MAQLALFAAFLLVLLATVMCNVPADNEYRALKRHATLSSCARMKDGALGAKAAQVACIGSCKFQNCGTGHCAFRHNRPVCVCSRCGSGGGAWPSVPGK